MVINFDMDGTIYDFYSQPNWLEKLSNEDATAYAIGAPLCDMGQLKSELLELKELGCEINVITWASQNATEEFYKKIQETKINWLKQQGLAEVFNKIIVTSYGKPKSKALKKRKKMILFDDNPEVRAEWNTPKQRIAYDEKNIIGKLKEIKKELVIT